MAVAVIVGGYAWLLPHFFHSEKTYSVLIGGVALAAMLAGVVAKVSVSAVGARSLIFAMFWGVVVGSTVLLGALGVLITLFGS